MMNLKLLTTILLFLVLQKMQGEEEGTLVVEDPDSQITSALRVIVSSYLTKDRVVTILILILPTKRKIDLMLVKYSKMELQQIINRRKIKYMLVMVLASRFSRWVTLSSSPSPFELQII